MIHKTTIYALRTLKLATVVAIGGVLATIVYGLHSVE